MCPLSLSWISGSHPWWQPSLFGKTDMAVLANLVDKAESVFGPKNFDSTKILCPKNFFVSKNAASRIDLGPKNFWAMKKYQSIKFFFRSQYLEQIKVTIWVPKIIWDMKKYRSQKTLGPKKFLVPKNFRSRKNSGPENIWVLNQFGS